MIVGRGEERAVRGTGAETDPPCSITCDVHSKLPTIDVTTRSSLRFDTREKLED